VADARGEEVCDGEPREEDALRAQDHKAHWPAGRAEFEEGEEVHSFVVGFFEEGCYPTLC